MSKLILKAMTKQNIVYGLLILVFGTAFGDDVDDACGPNQPKIITAGTASSVGNIYSPGYQKKQNYPNFVECSYQIYAPAGHHIRLKFIDLDIEASDSCGSDMLHIFDFDSQGNSLSKAMLCGSQTPRDMISLTSVIHLTFTSNVFDTKRGFNISYSVSYSPGLCPAGYLECRNRNCVPKSTTCNGLDDCGDGTDEEKCGLPLPVLDCGNPVISPMSGTDRIVGGKEVTPGSWPWMADLQLKTVEPNGHVCGGTLINAQWVVTAAHCFGDLREARRWRVHLGNHNKYKTDPNEQVRFVERVIIYDDIPQSVFESNGEYDMVHDMALMKLNAPVKITSYVRPACLPPAGTELQAQTACYATGWGVTRGTGSSQSLKQAYHPVQPDTVCTGRVGSQFNAATMICAGSLSPLNGVCHGDSGGPLLCKIDKKWHVFGVTSFGTDGNFMEGLCGLEQRPTIFNKVSAKILWISKMINKYT